MNQPGNAGEVIRTVQNQLECDLYLGGYWLPIGKLKPAANMPVRPPVAPAGSPARAASQEWKMSDAESMKEKQKRLDDLARRMGPCCRCSLAQTRLHLVPGEGNPCARIVFVGEAPGASEDEQGRPFVGRAGQLLTNIIEAMGLRRQEVYICNILKCRPPDNRDPQANEIAACIEYLYEQLRIIEPEMIVALGAHAAKTLLNSTAAIGELRGRVHAYYPEPLSKPIKLMATYHPAYLLRNYSPDNRRRVWHDMQTVLKELGLPVPRGKQE